MFRTNGRPSAARRGFLRRAGTAAAGMAAASAATAAGARPEQVLRIQGAWSARDVFHEYALDFSRRVNDMSGGRLRMEVLPADALLKPQELLDAVHQGALDGCHGAAPLWSLRNAAFSLFGEAPAMGVDADAMLGWLRYGGGADLYADLLLRQMNLQVVSFFSVALPPRPLGWFRRAPSSAAALRGLVVPARGFDADLLKEMGAKPVIVDDRDVPALFASGKIDAVLINSASSVRRMPVIPGITACLLQSQTHAAEFFEISFNRKRFDALPADLQAVIRSAADAASSDVQWKSRFQGSVDAEWLERSRGIRMVKTPPDILRAQMRAWSTVLERHSASNPFFGKVLDSQQQWAQRVFAGSRDSATAAALAHAYWQPGSLRRARTNR
jgi:TRAP-type mannitol/chloroaromatic compound transport system substrate-binding protein